MITGCDSVGVLDQAIAAALAFKPLSPAEVQRLLERTTQAASAGKFERFESGDNFDSTAKHPHWLEDAKI
jgi:ABC-type branched-subunit amino acid transport system substrate-binding protein